MKLYKKTTASRLSAPQPAIIEYPEEHPATLDDLKAALAEHGMVAVPVEDLDNVCESMELWGMHSDDAYQTIKAMIKAAEDNNG